MQSVKNSDEARGVGVKTRTLLFNNSEPGIPDQYNVDFDSHMRFSRARGALHSLEPWTKLRVIVITCLSYLNDTVFRRQSCILETLTFRFRKWPEGLDLCQVS